MARAQDAKIVFLCLFKHIFRPEQGLFRQERFLMPRRIREVDRSDGISGRVHHQKHQTVTNDTVTQRCRVPAKGFSIPKIRIKRCEFRLRYRRKIVISGEHINIQPAVLRLFQLRRQSGMTRVSPAVDQIARQKDHIRSLLFGVPQQRVHEFHAVLDRRGFFPLLRVVGVQMKIGRHGDPEPALRRKGRRGGIGSLQTRKLPLTACHGKQGQNRKQDQESFFQDMFHSCFNRQIVYRFASRSTSSLFSYRTQPPAWSSRR